MARFLFSTVPFSGHVNPGQPIAEALVERGHDVVWYTAEAHRRAIERTGARFTPFDRAMDCNDNLIDAILPERKKLHALAQLKYDVKHFFIDWSPSMLEDLSDICDREQVDAVVGDSASIAPMLLSERRGIPWAVYGITPLAMSSRDTAPFGMGLMPSSTAFGRMRNGALRWLAESVVFRDVERHWAATRRSLGFSAPKYPLFDSPRQAQLVLQATIPSFEFDRSDLPSTVKFIGAFVPSAPNDWIPPSWWSELGRAKHVVLVTQGTIANDYDDLLRPAIRALADMDALVILTTGSRPASELGVRELPPNVRVERFVPYEKLMPNVDVLVTNGGYGSIQIAIAHGVPVAAFGETEEKPEIANRVEWSGLGIGVKIKRPTDQQIRVVVERILGNDAYVRRAAEMKREAAQYDAPALAVEYLETLTKSGDARRESAA